MPAQSVTFAAKAGQEVFSTPFPVNVGGDATVTVNGVSAPFTAIGYGIDLTTPVATDGHLVVVTQTVSGAVASTAVSGGVNGGSALTLTGGCLPIGGSDGSVARMLKVDANGFLVTNGAFTSGATSVAASGAMVGGSDGSVYRHIALDTSGNQKVVGNYAGGASVTRATAPTLIIGGVDGGNIVRPLSVDVNGCVPVLGGLTTGVSVAGAGGSMIGGSDGTNYRHIAVNSAGQLVLSGVNTNGNAHGTAVLSVAGSDGTNARALRTDTSGNLANYETRRTVFQNETTTSLAGAATFTGTSRDAGVAANSSYWGLYFNGFFLANQAGTALIEGSNDNTTWFTVATAALAVNTPLILQVPVMTRYHRVKVVNGATAQTSFFANSSYSAG